MKEAERLKAFVLETHKALVHLEQPRLHQAISLHHIARYDVGAMEDSSGKLQFFVGEVTRAPRMSMYLHSVYENLVGITSSKIVEQALLQMVHTHRNTPMGRHMASLETS